MRPGTRRAVLLFLCLAGVLLRIAVFDAGVHRGDSYGLREWTWALVQHPLSSFYGHNLEVAQDHLPGDLWLLFLLGRLTWWVSPGFNFYDDAYTPVLKAVPLVADVAIALLLARLVRRFADDRWSLAIAGAYLLGPAPIVVGSLWGQWDAVSLAIVILALGAMMRGRLASGMAMLTLACLVKPQFGLLLPLFGIAWLRSVWTGGTPVSGKEVLRVVGDRWRAVAGALLASAATLLAVCLPFGVSLSGAFTGHSILCRLSFSLDRYQATTLGANNLWILPIGRGNPPWDGETILPGLTYQQVGTLLVLLCWVVAGVAVARLPDPAEALVWGSAFVMMGAFLFSTRMHERYLFPVVGLSLLLCAFRPRYGVFAAGVSLACAANVYLSMTWGWANGQNDMPPIPALDHDSVPRALALLTLGLFAWLGTQGLEMAREGHASARPKGPIRTSVLRKKAHESAQTGLSPGPVSLRQTGLSGILDGKPPPEGHHYRGHFPRRGA